MATGPIAPARARRKRSPNDLAIMSDGEGAVAMAIRDGVPAVQPRIRLTSLVGAALEKGDLLIVAGVGFGKRVLLNTWATQTPEWPIVWLDDDQPLPDPKTQCVVAVEASNVAVAEKLGKTRRVWRMVVIARQTPARDLTIALLNGTLTIIDVDQLRMTAAEISALVPGTNWSAIARILELTGGWPIAVQALVQRLSIGSSAAQDIERACVDLSAAIFDFCETHILADAEPIERAHLTAICAMSEIDVALADLLAGEGEGRNALDTGLRFGLVRRMPNRAARWQLCHPVLSRHLQHIQNEKDMFVIRQLHSRAADHFAAAGEAELAIFHARYAENWLQVASLVERAGGWRLAVDLRDRQTTRDWLHNCVEDIPEALVDANPALRLARAMLRFCCGEIRPAMRDYDHLVTQRDTLPVDMSLEITIVGHLMPMLDERPPSDECRWGIEECLKRIPSSDVLTVALMENALSIAAGQRGETEVALESGERARRLYTRLGLEVPFAVVGLRQGRTCSEAGMRNQALKHFRASLESFEHTLGFNSDLARCSRVLLGQEAYAGNDLETASACLADSLPWVEAQEPQFHAAAYLTSTKLAVLDRGLDAGADIVDTCIRFAQRRGLTRLERLAQICWLEQLCGADEGKAAARLAKQIDLEALTENRDDRLLALAATMMLCEIHINCGNAMMAQERLISYRQSDLWLETTASRAQWHILSSLASLQLGAQDGAVQAIGEAIRYAMPEGLTRMFIARGRDIYPILRDRQRAQHRKGRFANHAEEEFVTDIVGSIRRERRMHRLAIEGVSLTAKEEEIADLLTKGLSNKEIARLVGASDNTVKWHLKNLFRLFNVSSRGELVTSYQINLQKRTEHNVSVTMTSFRIQ